MILFNSGFTSFPVNGLSGILTALVSIKPKLPYLNDLLSSRIKFFHL